MKLPVPAIGGAFVYSLTLYLLGANLWGPYMR